MKNSIFDNKQSDFIEYLFSQSQNGNKNLPPIADIGKDLGVSTPNVRELVAIGKTLGLIRVQPRTGISILPYDFSPAVSKSVYCAVKIDPIYFEQYSHLRNEIEKSYFIDAAESLTKGDIQLLNKIVNQAISKLNADPIQIPHEEHRAFHLTIYKNLENVFITGLLRSYWDLYENIGLNMYTELSYLRMVWNYHHEIVQAISSGLFSQAYQLLSDHIALIGQRGETAGSESDGKYGK